MRHKVATFKVGRSGAHRRAMLANMATSLFANGQIETTLVKAKELRRYAEKLITIGKKGDIHNRRLAFAKLHSRDAVKHLFDVVAPEYAQRNGGYTRIYKLGFRRGDAAEMCLIQLVKAEAAEEPKKEAKKAAKKEPKKEAEKAE